MRFGWKCQCGGGFGVNIRVRVSNEWSMLLIKGEKYGCEWIGLDMEESCGVRMCRRMRKMGKDDEDYSARVERLVEMGMLHARMSITRPDSRQYSALSV